MFGTTLGVQYNNRQHSDVSHALVKSIRSFINSTPDHQRKTSEFISDLIQRLYLLHEYNCQVSKWTGKYPKSRNLDLLLVKYVELEFECLYYKNLHPPEEVEITTESRVCHLLQTMLNQAVHCTENIVNEEVVMRKAILQLLGKLRAEYLATNKLVDNIVQKLVETNRSDSKTSSVSGYASDESDSGLQVDFFCDNSSRNSNIRVNEENKFVDDSIIVCSDSEDERPKTRNNVGVVTFEILDDDDGDDLNYMVYLHKETKTNKKRKKQKIITHEIVVSSDSENEDSPSCLQKTDICVNVETGVQEETIQKNSLFDEETLDNFLQFVASESSENCSTTLTDVEATKEKQTLMTKDCIEITSLMLNFNDNQDSNLKSSFLTAPNTLFDQLISGHSSKPEEIPLMAEIDNQRIATVSCEEFMKNVDGLGDPVLAEKASNNVDFDGFSDDPISASLLEEFLLDDSYLLEGRKEFEQLENFLFYEGSEKL